MDESFFVPAAPARQAQTRIVLGPGTRTRLRTDFESVLGPRRRLCIIDRRVRTLWADKLGIAAQELIEVPAGEAAKTPEVLIKVCRELIRRGLGRDGAVLAIGGGSCTDLAGCAASLHMRGIPVVHLPTTLLAMVDAGLGGKCGIDLPEGKNLIGSFWAPSLLLVDPDFLATLPIEELRAGLGEVAKYALGFQAGLFERLEALDPQEALKPAKASSCLADAIRDCLQCKAQLVTEDMYEREGGRRILLNLGHTSAHALEAIALNSQRTASHGLAVGFGLRIAARLAHELDMLTTAELARSNALCDRLGLARSAQEVCGQGVSPEQLLPYLLRDKKALETGKSCKQLRVVLPDGIGSCRLVDVQARRFAASMCSSR